MEAWIDRRIETLLPELRAAPSSQWRELLCAALTETWDDGFDSGHAQAYDELEPLGEEEEEV